jgi:hypothetical protein
MKILLRIVKKERSSDLTTRLKLSKAPFFKDLVTSFDDALLGSQDVAPREPTGSAVEMRKAKGT